MTPPHNNQQGTAGSEQQQEYIYWKDATPEDFENATTSCWIEGVGDVSTEYERKFVQRFGVALRTLSHTSPQAPEPATAPCPQHRIWQHCPVAAQVAKAERERDQKQWQKLEDYINAHSPWVPGTDDRVIDARKLIAEVKLLRSKQEIDS